MSIRLRINNLPKQLRNKITKEKLINICEENDVVFMALFGSFIRGQQKKRSDIDIAIKYRKGAGKSLLDLIGLEFKLRRVFGRKVDLGTFDSINPYIIDDVKKEMRIIYEKE